MYTLNETEEFLCKEIIDCAFTVHKKLGSGLLEKIYEACFCYELTKRDIPFRRQAKLPVYYDDRIFDEGQVIDVLVDNNIICELKVQTLNTIWQAQVLSHLKLSDLHVGFLINFNNALLKDGIRRYCI